MDKKSNEDEAFRSRFRASVTRSDYIGRGLSDSAKNLSKKKQSSNLLKLVKTEFAKLNRKFRVITKNSNLANSPKVKLVILGVAIVSVLLLVNASRSATDKASDTLTADNNASSSGTQIETLDKPDFDVLIPAGKTIDTLTKSETRVTPNKDIIFSFSDELNNLPIEVTEQKIPDSFISDKQGQLKNIASQFQMGNVISIDGNLIYHGVSEQTGTQSLVMIIEDKLIFIRSPQKLSDDTWAGYIKSFNRGR